MHGIFFQHSDEQHKLKALEAIWKVPNTDHLKQIPFSSHSELYHIDGQTADESYFENERIIILIDGSLSLKNGDASLKQALKILAQQFINSGYQGVIAEIVAGSFNLVIFDKHQQQLYFINDFIGSIPLHYAHENNNLVISTNPRSILKTGLIDKTIDMTGVASFIYLGYGFASRHIIKQITKLPANHCLRYDFNAKSLSVLKGNHNIFETFPRQEKYQKSAYAPLIKNACHRVSINSGKTASFLSGGLDSRMVTAAWPANNKLEHFTYGADGSAEVAFAKMVARVNRAPLHHQIPQGDEIAEQLTDIFEFSGLACFPERYYFAKLMAETGFNSVNDGFLIDVFMGGDFFHNDSYLSTTTKLAKYLSLFLDQSTKNHSLESIAMAYWQHHNLVKSNDSLCGFLEQDFIASLAAEKENIVNDLVEQVRYLAQFTDSVAYIFRNLTASNRSANYTLTQGVNARQHLKVNYPLGLDKDLIFESLKLSPNQAAYRRGQLKALQDNFIDYAKIPYSRTLVPATYPPIAHKWASILNNKGIYLPGFNDHYKHKQLQFSNWAAWSQTSEPLRELAKAWLISGNVTSEHKINQFFTQLSQGKQTITGHLFHIAGVARWLSNDAQ